MEKRVVYADNAATTAVSDAALAAMQPYFQQEYGNASSIHDAGQTARRAIEAARKSIAKSIGAYHNEVFFTSGGTESDNWAIFGSLLDKNAKKGKHIVVSSIEHSAVHRTAEFLETMGYEATYLPVDIYGSVTPAQLEAALRDDTVLVSIMMANNEIGTILPIRELCEVAHARRIPFHTDAVQAVGHIPVDVHALGVDMLSLSAHKFHGPKGVGALYMKLGRVLPPVMIGGGQESNRRSGTENVPGIVGMATALEEATANMRANIRKVTAMRDRVIQAVLKIDGAELTGHPKDRLPGIASFVFHGLTSTAIVAELAREGICASSGAACSSGSTELTRALKEVPVRDNEKYGEKVPAALRISLNEYNTNADIDYILHKLPMVVAVLKTTQMGSNVISYGHGHILENPDLD